MKGKIIIYFFRILLIVTLALGVINFLEVKSLRMFMSKEFAIARQASSENVIEVKTTAPTFELIEEYGAFVFTPEAREFEAAQPKGFVIVKVDGEFMRVAPPTVSQDVYVLAKPNYDSVSKDIVQTFYLQVHPKPGTSELVKWYGPFEGKIFARFVQ